MRIKVIDIEGNEVYLGFTLKSAPRIGEIVQNSNGLQFEVLNVLHRVHEINDKHVIEIQIGKALK